jgi:hypothetical protein
LSMYTNASLLIVSYMYARFIGGLCFFDELL